MYIDSSILHLYLVPSFPFLRRFYFFILSQLDPLPSSLSFTQEQLSSGVCHLQYTVTGKTEGTSSVVCCVITGKRTCIYTCILTVLCRR